VFGGVLEVTGTRAESVLAGYGVQPVRQVSLDDTWSALRFRPAKQ
jgi:hypothetical protein